MTGKRSPALPDALEEGPRSVLEALAAGACSPGELVAVTGRPARTISRYLARLRDSALVEGLQTEPRLTAAGQRVGPTRAANSGYRLRPDGLRDPPGTTSGDLSPHG